MLQAEALKQDETLDELQKLLQDQYLLDVAGIRHSQMRLPKMYLNVL